MTIEIPQVGGSYNEGIIGQPRIINPVYATTDADRDLSRLIFSRLLTYKNNGELATDLALNYEIDKGAKIYTITLKDNLFWQDGDPLDVDDVVFTVKTIQNPQYKSPLRANWQGVETEKIDPKTIRFTLRTPYSPFIENLTLGIIPKHLWKNINPEQAILHELNLKPVGSGPYIYDDLEQNKDGTIEWYKLKRNPYYHNSTSYLKKLTFYFFDSEDKMIVAWHKGRIAGLGPVSSKKESELNPKKININKIAMPRIFGIFFNEKKSATLRAKSTRRAIAHALNKEEIALRVAFAGATPHDSIFPAHTPGFTQDITGYPFDIQRSNQILDEAGFKDINGDGIRDFKEKVSGKEIIKPLKFILSTSDWPDLVRTAEYIKESLKKIGIDIAVESHAFSELENNVIRSRNFELLLFGQVYSYELDPFAFWHSSQVKDPGINISGYTNKKVDVLLEEARRSSDPETRSKKFQEIQKTISDDIPVIILYSQLYPYGVTTSIRGVLIKKVSLPADRFNEINKWYRETKRVFK